jgi:ABC-type dipeptide/oligopeptide/nickel transport system ATPase component
MNLPSGCIYRPRCDIAIADCARIVPPPEPVRDEPAHLARCIRVNER